MFLFHQILMRTSTTSQMHLHILLVLFDEDITSLDMTKIAPSKPKVKSIHVRFTFYIFDELLLHRKVCLLSFSEVLTWIKRWVDSTREAWMVHEVDWEPDLIVPNMLYQATTPLLAQGEKESKSNTYWWADSDCRTAPTCDGHHDSIRTPIWMF